MMIASGPFAVSGCAMGILTRNLKSQEPGNGRKRPKRLRLKATTAASARQELEKLKLQRAENTLPILAQVPKFSDYKETYLAHFRQVKDAKRPSTMAKEKKTLRLWEMHLGEVRLNQITRAQINNFIHQRQAAGKSGRTVNLDLIALRNVLKRARDDGYLSALPTDHLRPLKWRPPMRSLVSLAQIKDVCQKAIENCKNGREFADYIFLMAYAGSRRDETLRLRWEDVDWKRKLLCVGSDGLSKNRQPRFIDFSSELEAHLKNMFSSKAPDSKFLFPSPQRGENDKAAKTFREALDTVRQKAGQPSFRFMTSAIFLFPSA